MSEIITQLKLIMMIPATNAVNEHSGFAVCKVKNYLKSTMSDVRFNILLILHVHKERTDYLQLPACLNENH